MNTTLNPPTDADSAPPQAPLCDPCAAIQQHWRRAPGHAELMQGVNRKELRGEKTVTVTRYRCDHCGTRWDYENNKADQHAGWSLVR